ncbi:Protein bric-a-brac 1 [Nymphon striatum]|nr:Protein bric-a-brac 1 [Nymphon striatum]
MLLLFTGEYYSIMTSQQLCVKWNNHQNNMLGIFSELLVNDHFVDVTIACDGESLKAHRMVLSACSPFFKDLLISNPCPHPIIILNNIDFKDLKILLDFMYKGQVNVRKDKLQNVLKAAEILKVKGLGEVAKSNKEFSSSEKQPIKPTTSSSTSRKQSDHHYSCSSPKVPATKRRKSAPIISEVKAIEIPADFNINESKEIEKPESETIEETANDPVISESILPPLVVEQSVIDQTTQDSELSSLKNDDPNATSSESCVITMPLIDADSDALSGLSVSQLDGKQFAQVTDASGNTVLVLIPDSSSNELTLSASDEIINTVEQPDYTELHFKRNDGTTMKLYQCLHCDSKFANPGNVRRHTYSAHKGFRIQCEVCQALFTQKSSKDFHFRTVHAGVRYHCDECDSQFTEKRTLLHHISNMHPKEIPDQ